eukprot:CAMPEP_0114251570 /NCGR_PEP_ID=MMETSP0058-20121206/15344_1 /TAXON_ID=36894 /ORGANISM="Pyramimonas parkeae, CCMP726" /LENGTH=334 /DNA_ID=CAMNT_0001365387 /DNA_START=35 /DNA_END=1039 /DNA_ORIENTATION=+
MGADDRANVVSAFLFISNITASISIIMVNKQLMHKGGYGFNFATTLCGLHFLITWAMSGLTGWLFSSDSKDDKKAEKPHVPVIDVVLFTICADLSIVGMNMSLMMNTVGFYQISKLSIIPVICAIDFLWLYKVFNQKIIASIALVLLGVGISTVSDMGFNAPGVMMAAIAVFATAMQQVLVGHLQKKHNIGANELVGVTAPVQAMSMLLVGPFIDRVVVGAFPWTYEWHVPSLIFLLGSCFLAAVVNISQYFCIGRFSAVSFQVLGHSKTLGVLFFGWLIFSAPVTWKNFIGMSLAVVGMVLYGVFSVSDPPKVVRPPTANTAEVKASNAEQQT